MARWIDVLLLRLRSLFRRSTLDRELEREMAFHLEEEIDALVAGGMSRSDARWQALRDFGSPAGIAQQCRETRRVNVVENIVQDLRYAARVLLKQPLLVVIAATSIALGVGANLTIFALANSLLLSQPTARDSERLVHIRSDRGSHVSYQMWRALDESQVIAGVAGYSIENDVNLRVGTDSISVLPLVVSANFFDVVGVPMAMGRGFTAGEANAEREPRLVIVAHRFWASRLNRDADVIGTSLLVNGMPFSIIGVLPEDLRSLPGYGIAPDLWLPISRTLAPDLDRPQGTHFQLIGRLREGQTIDGAWAALNTVAGRQSDAPRGGSTIRNVAPLGGIFQLNEFKEIAVFFAGLIIVTWLVLAIACANVAGLLLARGIARRKEVAMRLAIGASRGRVIQQLLAEGFLLSIIGTLVGLAVTAALSRLIAQVQLPLPIPFVFHVDLNGRVVAVAAALIVVSTIVSALMPARQTTRPDVLSALKQEGRLVGQRRFNTRGMLVAGQVAVSVILLVVTALFLRNLSLARTVDPGFDADRLLVAQVTFVEGRQGTVEQPAIEPMAAAVGQLPDVDTVSFAGGVPLTMRNGGTTGTQVRIDGRDGLVRVDYDENKVGPSYFETMGIALVRGREFGPADRIASPPPAIVNEEFVRRYFEGQDPIGRGIYFEADRRARTEVIGVVADSKYTTIGEDHDAAVYTAYAAGASPDRLVHLLVHTRGAPERALASVREAIQKTDPSAAVTIEPMTSAVAFAFLPSRIGAALVGALGTLGAVLAMIGLYGVISFAVTRRTPEIGIRLALGSSRWAVAALVFRDSARLVGVGLTVGLALAWLIAKPLSAFLVAGLSTTDTPSFLAVVILIVVTSALAGYGPTRRAMRVEPAATLRSE